MKTQKFIGIVIGLVLLAGSANATGTETAIKTATFSLHQQFARQMECPHFMLQHMYEETVTLQFHIQNDFSVVVEEIACRDERLRQYVEKALRTKKIYIDRQDVGKSYSIKMTFKK